MKNKNFLTALCIAIVVLLIGGLIYFIAVKKNDSTIQSPTQSNTANNAPNARSDPNSILISNYMFTPSTVTIKKGTTLTWTNNDIAKHTITADDNSFASNLFGKGETYSYTFNKTGTIIYHCEPHPYMKATITVTD